jgi:Ca-activated chloride channel family protein
LEFITYQPLIWLAVVAVLALGLRYSLVDRPAWQRFASFAMRVTGVVLLILALCRPFWSEPSDDLHVVLLVDVSQSVDLDSVKTAVGEIQQTIDNLHAGDSWSLFTVGSGVKIIDELDELEELLGNWQTGVSDHRFRSATRLADALLDTRLAFPAGKSRRTVLYSDGQETHADIAAALRQMREEKIDVRLKRIDGLAHPEAAVVSVQPSTPNAFHGEVVRMTVKLATNKQLGGKLRIVHKGVAVLDRQIALNPDKQNVVHFDVNMATSGASVWTAELIPEEDYFPINNQSSCTVMVRGKPRVLVLHEKPTEMRTFSRALEGQDFDIDVRGKFGLPDSMEGMLAFDAILLADMAATSMAPRQMELLKRYVMDFGGGLVMLGSENSFGLGGYYKTPVEEVLPLVSRFEKEKEKPSLAMVLVIDKSGSMSGAPIALARQAAKAAVELLGPRDSIGVVGFDGQPYVICEMRSAAESDAVNASIDSLQAGGGTYMFPAMVSGKDMLENTSAKIRHMIVLSDGQTQAADHEGLTQAMADAGITVSTVALGSADRQLLAGIAEIGRGRYYETNDPANVPQIFTKETMQASRSAIKEDLFGTVQTGDHPILAGYREADLPFSLGYVMTEAKPTAQLLLVAETGDPLLAVSQYGLGMGMGYTSDLTERWGGEWLAWNDCGRFWAQALRGVVRHADTEGLQVDNRQDFDVWNLDITRTAKNGAPVTEVLWDASALD